MKKVLFTISIISYLSSGGKRLGTSHVLSKLLISSTKYSLLIYESVNKNTVGVFFPPAIFKIFFKSSPHSGLSYYFVISICITLNSFIEAPKVVKDYLPEPPTPIKRAFPPGDFKILHIINKCSIAN